ncbi:MAG: VOC family protein [Solirubrobacteraceae bacterium]
MSLPAETSIGAVALTVSDLETVEAFYRETIGLQAGERTEDGVLLGAVPGRPLVELVSSPGAAPRPPRTTGLFHLALLVPGRAALGGALHRLAAHGARLSGASDHLVSEALYLADPEGNGIEIYRDRPREEWQREGDGIRMATLPLDLEGVLAAAGETPEAIEPQTVIGHVHLNVADLEASERFYAGMLGFDVTSRGYPGALFVSAGGYHHHVGLNTWNGAGAPPAPAGARGLASFEIRVPENGGAAAIAERLRASGAPVDDTDGALLTTDPSGNALRLRAG